MRSNRVNRARPSGLDADRARTALDRERRLVTEAILLVSRGGSRRVTVAGLRYPTPVIEASRAYATDRHVRLVSLRTDDERGSDIAVEAIEAPATAAEPRLIEPSALTPAIRAAAQSS